MSLRTWVRVWKKSIAGGKEFSRWEIGINLFFRENLEKLEKGKTLSEKALCIHWNSDLNFLRRELPLLDTVTKAIAQSVRRWGSAKNKSSCVDPGMMREVCRLCAERSWEKEVIRRKTLTIALFRGRESVWKR